MAMIDHLSLGVPEIAASRAFYDPTLAAIGCVASAPETALPRTGGLMWSSL